MRTFERIEIERLDAFTLNHISLSLYRSLGFQDRGIVRFRKGLFICFEKTLDTSKGTQK